MNSLIALIVSALLIVAVTIVSAAEAPLSPSPTSPEGVETTIRSIAPRLLPSVTAPDAVLALPKISKRCAWALEIHAGFIDGQCNLKAGCSSSDEHWTLLFLGRLLRKMRTRSDCDIDMKRLADTIQKLHKEHFPNPDM